MKNFRHVIFFLQIGLTTVLSNIAIAQQCNMSGKTIFFRHTMCGPNGCERGQERLEFVGEKVLEFSDPSSRVGTVYYLGKTVEFCNAHLETYRADLCTIQGVAIRSNGSASFNGGELRLTLTQSIPETRITSAGTTTQFIQVAVQACRTCVLQNVIVESILSNGQPAFRSRMVSAESCQVIDNNSVPR